jgi:nucleotide-binding universal stress UspA family protein
MIKSILLSVDGSTYTGAQVKHCIQLARAFESLVHVISIVDIRIFEWATVMSTDGFVPVIPSTVYQNESKKMLDTKADAVLAKCSRILKSEKVEFDTQKIAGPPADIICDHGHMVDMLIIGARGEFAKWESKWIGATLEVVVRQFNKPILITPEKECTIAKILIAYDGTNKANKALQMAAFFATKLAIPVVILSVHDNERLRNKNLLEAKTYLEPYNISLEAIGLSGAPEKEILKTAKARKCDLIIMGAFGHSRIREAILGSTTDYVMRNSALPVLLCK